MEVCSGHVTAQRQAAGFDQTTASTADRKTRATVEIRHKITVVMTRILRRAALLMMRPQRHAAAAATAA